MTIDLLHSPHWQPQHLGLPMPDDPHAVSACLPLWRHNIAYEEGDADVMNALQAAYPRFCLHPDVQRLCEQLFPGGYGLPFATRAAADRAVAYVEENGGSAKLAEIPGQTAWGVSVDEKDLASLKQYWQHAGENVSSRAAEAILAGECVTNLETAERTEVRRRVAELHHTSVDNVFLFPSGMAAIAAAWRAGRQGKAEHPTAQFGFPYVDTFKLHERFAPRDCDLFHCGDETDLAILEARFPERHFSVVLCETPGNPLLTVPDLKPLLEVTRKHDSVLIVDDTLRACSRDTVLPFSDVVCTSLTKYFSGYGNVLAGALILNPDSPHFDGLSGAVADDYEESLCDADVGVLERNSRDLEERVVVMVRNARELVARLKRHPAVETVYYPGADQDASGALFSIVLKNAEQTTPAVFDALQINKGPNLGTNFTLCCPFTILAHYNELDFVESCGVSRWLLRFSVGVESVDDLWDRIAMALDAAGCAPG